MTLQPSQSSQSSKCPVSTQTWKNNFLPHFSVFNILLHFLDMPCSLIDLQTQNWLLFSRRYRPLDTVQFELHFGKRALRLRYNLDCFKKVARTRKSLIADFGGFWD